MHNPIHKMEAKIVLEFVVIVLRNADHSCRIAQTRPNNNTTKMAPAITTTWEKKRTSVDIE